MSSWPLLDEVLQAWGARLPLDPQELAAIGGEAGRRAFWLAGVWEKRFLEDAQASLGKAMEEGKTLYQWLPEAQRLIAGYGGTVKLYRGGDEWNPWYADLVIRNAVQRSFSDGRYAAMFGEEWKKRAPFWRYYATLDARTRPTHAALHGKVFRKDDTAALAFYPPWGHSCFPAETPILGSIRAGVRSRYSGPVVRIQTRAGNRLTLTVDHPVLTPRGWVAAKLLREGDDVFSHVEGAEGGLDAARTDEAVRRILGPRKTRLAAPRLNVHGRPAFAGELFGALPEALRESRVGVRSKDLYGDARVEERHVEVEREHGKLLLHAKAAAAQLVRDLRFAIVHVDHAFVAGLRHADALLERYLAAAGGLPGLGELAFDGGGIVLQASPLHAFRLASTPERHTHLLKRDRQAPAREPGLAGQLLHRLAGSVAVSEGGQARDCEPPSAPALQGLLRDAAVSVRHGSFDGDVFDFETSHGWMIAAGIVISNCRCQAIEMTLEEFEAGGYQVTQSSVVPTLLTRDGEPVGAPPEGWGADRPGGIGSPTLQRKARPAKRVAPPKVAPPKAAPPAASAPSPAPGAPPSPTKGPKGPAVSGHVSFISPARKADGQRIFGLIDSVHGDGTLGDMRINFLKGTGGFWKPGKIKVGRDAPHWAVQQAHEVGHWLDRVGMSPGRFVPASHTALMDDVMKAIRSSDAFSRLSASGLHPQDRKYLLRPTELWARAYSQYIAEETGDQEMLDQIALWRAGKAAGRHPLGQWESLDFAPIRDEISKLMRKLGWQT